MISSDKVHKCKALEKYPCRCGESKPQLVYHMIIKEPDEEVLGFTADYVYVKCASCGRRTKFYPLYYDPGFDAIKQAKDDWKKSSTNISYGQSKQPCWTCKKFAVGCSWAEKQIPVEGWDATPNVVAFTYASNKSDGTYVSYEIHNCPNYEYDGT